MEYKEVEGNLIELAYTGAFDVIAHGCNCFCKQKSGIAKEMVKHFKTNTFRLEGDFFKGQINKLGNIDYELRHLEGGKWVKYPDENGEWVEHSLNIVNCYSQYRYGKNHPDGDYNPIDYEALQLCLRKINHTFKGKHIGLPKIGCGLAGGKWSIVKKLIRAELADMRVTIVTLKK